MRSLGAFWTDAGDFPVLATGYDEASRLVLAYVLQVLQLDDFEMRIVGA